MAYTSLISAKTLHTIYLSLTNVQNIHVKSSNFISFICFTKYLANCFRREVTVFIRIHFLKTPSSWRVLSLSPQFLRGHFIQLLISTFNCYFILFHSFVTYECSEHVESNVYFLIPATSPTTLHTTFNLI